MGVHSRKDHFNKNDYKFKPPRRDVNNLLDFSDESIIYENENNEDEKSIDTKNNDNRNNGLNNNHKDNWSNPLCKYLDGNVPYDRKIILFVMTKKHGLHKLIEDINLCRKENRREPFYTTQAFRDIIFAAALPEALDICTDKDNKNSDLYISKKDMSIIMDKLLQFLNQSYEQRIIDKYGPESVESMRKAYLNILYKYNKKKVKKFESIKNIPEGFAKQLVVLTCSKNVRTTIYAVIKFLYMSAQDLPGFKLDANNIEKIFKAAYGKSKIQDVVKYLMLEKVNPQAINQMNKPAVDVYAQLDLFLREKLESFEKKDIEKIILSYIDERRRQERDNKIYRRFGNRKTIHPDDYPKITKVCDQLEEKDFSLVRFLR